MAATTQHRFTIADRVIHPGKPEWGVGTVATASNTTHEGAPCQRLAIRFDRAGLKTITTAFVALQAAQAGDSAPRQSAAQSGDQPAHPAAVNTSDFPTDPKEARERMTRLPESATDPFSTPARRLSAMLDLYRFEPTAGSLIDWAAAQSRLADPLSRFNRHELEEFFHAFRRSLDSALRKGVQEASRLPPDELRAIASKAPPAAQRALQNLHRRR